MTAIGLRTQSPGAAALARVGRRGSSFRHEHHPLFLFLRSTADSRTASYEAPAKRVIFDPRVRQLHDEDFPGGNQEGVPGVVEG